MKKNYKVISILLLSFFFNVNAYSENIIVFLDVEFAVNNSKIGKNILKNLNEARIEEINNLKNIEKKLVKKEKEINNVKNVITKEELNLKINEFKKEVKEFNVKKDQIQKNFNDNKNKQLEELFKKINPLIVQYMNDNSIEMIISKKNVYLAKKNLDITDIIIELIDKNFQQ